ncbi:hypothetical protein ABHA39_16285 [Clostridium paraputrificum]|uniref:hypothetical protein n=1 Tax=Clostridium paraputrificum TaxID=29363 RepID=UPI00232E314C|nr:hypothetical protein [Clostridium paraputrificum]MDB2073352.1 hypothetical protein [Clostridium paraputrificum]
MEELRMYDSRSKAARKYNLDEKNCIKSREECENFNGEYETFRDSKNIIFENGKNFKMHDRFKIYDRKERSSYSMDENKILEKFIDNMNIDRREQEKRLSKNMELMEKRLELDRRLSEERLDAKFKETMDAIRATNDKIDDKVTRLENKLDGNLKWIIGTCLATILGIAAMVVTVLIK